MQGWRRHLEGWQLAVVAVGIALGAAVLSLPRPVAPRELPLPSVDRREEARADEQRQLFISRAKASPLPYLVRAAGEAFRRFGRAEAFGDAPLADALSASFAARVKDARQKHGDTPLLELRSVQADLFAGAVRNFGDKGAKTNLEELGGAFLELAKRSGWLAADGSAAIEPDALVILFTVRWTKLAGLLDTFPFTPSLNEWRLYYRTLILHPEVREGEEGSVVLLGKYVTALSRKDPDYPELLARGIIDHWKGEYQTADAVLTEYLRANPSGAYRLRAQNYLLAARRGIPGKPL